MIDPKQFRQLVIVPTLAQLGLGSIAAEELLLGTALTESGLMWLHQGGGGPALGVYQCEPATHDDLFNNFIAFRPDLASRLYPLRMSSLQPAFQLAANLAYATAICRIHYLRAPAPLPAAGDAMAMALYHKRFYNTAQGATDPHESVVNFQRAIAL